jgi:hypothetical protein
MKGGSQKASYKPCEDAGHRFVCVLHGHVYIPPMLLNIVSIDKVLIDDILYKIKITPVFRVMQALAWSRIT